MAEDLKTFEAVFLLDMSFQVEDERDAAVIAEDIALLHGIELIVVQAL